jgi:hypothetical protein
MRKLAAFVVLALISAGAALAANGDPQKHHNPADTARAKSVVVHAADLGLGWKGTKSSSGGSNLHCKGFEPDESDLVETGHADSLDYSKGFEFLSSSAGVFQSAAQAQASWNRIVKPGLLTCLTSLIEKQAGSGGAKLTVLGKSRLSFPRLAPRTAAFRLTFSFASQGTTLQGAIDLVLLGRSRIDFVLIHVGFGAPSTALEQKVAAAVASRMR